MIEIKNRHTGETIYVAKDATDMRSAVEAAIRDGAHLRGADLRRADLCRADLYGANLRGADLRGADLCRADLYGANLYGANLCGANLYGAHLYEADLCGAHLYEADLRRADLREMERVEMSGQLIPVLLPREVVERWAAARSVENDSAATHEACREALKQEHEPAADLPDYMIPPPFPSIQKEQA